jgi:hypothetical protein
MFNAVEPQITRRGFAMKTPSFSKSQEHIRRMELIAASKDDRATQIILLFCPPWRPILAALTATGFLLWLRLTG